MAMQMLHFRPLSVDELELKGQQAIYPYDIHIARALVAIELEAQGRTHEAFYLYERCDHP